MCGYIRIAVVVLLCHVVAILSAPDDLNTTVAKLQTSVNRLDTIIQDKNDQVQNLESRVDQLEKDLATEKSKTNALEARVEALENQTKSKTEDLNKVTAQLASTNATIQQLKDELNHQTHRLNNTKDRVVADTERVNQQLAQLTTSVTNALAIASNATTAVNNFKPTTIIQSNWNRTEVYFSFRDIQNKSEHIHIVGSHDDPLPFDTKIAMSHNHPFHKQEGTFIAPVHGLYTFTATLSAKVVNDYLQCYIMRGDTNHLVNLYISSDGIDSTTGTVVVELEKDQVVTISHCTGNGDIDSYKTSFSGFLINKLFD